jgi:hypothetical protein
LKVRRVPRHIFPLSDKHLLPEEKSLCRGSPHFAQYLDKKYRGRPTGCTDDEFDSSLEVLCKEAYKRMQAQHSKTSAS